jgi:hypothetical protein
MGNAVPARLLPAEAELEEDAKAELLAKFRAHGRRGNAKDEVWQSDNENLAASPWRNMGWPQRHACLQTKSLIPPSGGATSGQLARHQHGNQDNGPGSFLLPHLSSRRSAQTCRASAATSPTLRLRAAVGRCAGCTRCALWCGAGCAGTGKAQGRQALLLLLCVLMPLGQEVLKACPGMRSRHRPDTYGCLRTAHRVPCFGAHGAGQRC